MKLNIVFSVKVLFLSLLSFGCAFDSVRISASAQEQVPAPRRGSVDYQPSKQEEKVPPQFQLTARRFDFLQEFVPTRSQQFEISLVTFPSPVKTPHPNNNTVHCEYFRPLHAKEKHPGVIVLHILGGDFELSRLFCRHMACNGVGAMFVKMPYYGPRRQPDVPVRMVSDDPEEIVRGMTQAVLDIRCAAAWLRSREEVDAEQLGITGISLGGITSALAASAEPRFSKVCLMLAGGDMGVVGWESPELARLRRRWIAHGGNRESLEKTFKSIDPVTYAENVKGRKVLMLNARYDEVVPVSCTESLWKALGRPEIVWMDAGHYSAMRFIFESLAQVTRFFQPVKPVPLSTALKLE